MNAAFEDCRLLAERLTDQPADLAAELEQFQQQRKPDADAIAELALQNFVEMRDRVADPQFVAQKQIEAELHRRYPTGGFRSTPGSPSAMIGIRRLCASANGRKPSCSG